MAGERALRLQGFLVAIILLLILLRVPEPSTAQGQTSLQVGARGDDASIGNSGVRVEIQTNAYDAMRMVLDYFWVGTILQNRAFVQFGYALEPGLYCLKGMRERGAFTCLGHYEYLSTSDARWQWQYWPSLYGSDFYYEIGPTLSAGPNGTWHEYAITSGLDRNVSFNLDGEPVSSIDFQLSPSVEPPIIVAEKATYLETPSNLGPVEFRNLAYRTPDGWRSTDSLVSVIGCGINTICQKDIPYGVLLDGPNRIIAGSGVAQPRSGELLWTSGFVILNITARQNVQFRVTTIMGDQVFTERASVKVPKGLFVSVLLSTSSIPTSGLLGTIGAVDEFQGWDGYTRNESVRLLMDQDRILTASWRMTLGWMASVMMLIVGVLLSAVAVNIFLSRRRKPSRMNVIPG